MLNFETTLLLRWKICGIPIATPLRRGASPSTPPRPYDSIMQILRGRVFYPIIGSHFELLERSPKLVAGLAHLAFFIGPAWPEESAKPVLRPARHDVDVQVRHALAYAIVDRHERTFGPESFLNGAG